MCQLKQMTGSI